MKIPLFAFVLLCLPLGHRLAAASALANPAEGDFIVKDYQFSNGEKLPEVRIHYRTFGQPTRNAQGAVNNAVLLLHGTTGNGTQYLSAPLAGELFGAGQPLEAEKYYLILPDSLGRGSSSRPSEGLHQKFPHYGYGDAADLHYRLVTEKLGVARVRLVVGTSMGGMHTWLLLGKHPEFAEAALPIACQPLPIAGRNLAWRRIFIGALQSDPAFKEGEYATEPTSLPSMLAMFRLLTGSATDFETTTPDLAKTNAFLATANADVMASAGPTREKPSTRTI